MSRATIEAGVLIMLSRAALEDLIEAAVSRALGRAAEVPEFLTIEGVGSMLMVDPRTVRTYVAKEGLPAIQLPGGLRFKRTAVIAWADARTPGARPRRDTGTSDAAPRASS